MERIASLRIVLSRRRTSELESKWDELERGGLPGRSYGDGSRGSGEGFVPHVDHTDHEIRGARRRYDHHLMEIAAHLRELEQIEQTWLPPDPELEPERFAEWRAEKEKAAVAMVSPRAQSCSNPACARVVECTANDRLRSGRCSACFQYRRFHGGERPASLVAKDLVANTNRETA